LPGFSVALQHIDLIPKFLGSNMGIVNFSDNLTAPSQFTCC
jgi:hypothetical protein